VQLIGSVSAVFRLRCELIGSPIVRSKLDTRAAFRGLPHMTKLVRSFFDVLWPHSMLPQTSEVHWALILDTIKAGEARLKQMAAEGAQRLSTTATALLNERLAHATSGDPATMFDILHTHKIDEDGQPRVEYYDCDAGSITGEMMNCIFHTPLQGFPTLTHSKLFQITCRMWTGNSYAGGIMDRANDRTFVVFHALVGFFLKFTDGLALTDGL
jgi:hypothetical protein